MVVKRDFFQSCFVYLVTLTVVLSGATVRAQQTSSLGDQLDFNLEIANNHLWRGIEVSDGLVMCSALAIHDKHEYMKFGLWGGTNISGDYKEFNFFSEFRYAGWKLAFWDTYNFSPDATYNNREFFNYSAHSTGRFLDCILTYEAGQAYPRFPLTVSWSTILFGRDRWEDNSSNRYSSYLSASYPLFHSHGWYSDLTVGGTFTWKRKSDDRSTFYSDRPGIIHLELQVRKEVVITSGYTLPLFASAVFNPRMNRAFFQIGATLFQF